MLGRLIVGIPIAAVVTLSLFFLMQYLIEPGDKQEQEKIQTVNIELLRAERDEESRRRELARPDEHEQPPEPPKIDPKMDRAPRIEGMGASMPGLNVDLSGGMTMGGVLDGDVQPIVRVPPQYPPSAAQRGLEGYVIVEYTVTRTGSVSDIVVIESSSEVFERPVLEAVAAYRTVYETPKAVWLDSRGVRIEIDWQATDDSTLVAEWTAPNESGRTTYRVVDPDAVEVTDEVRTDEGWRTFATARYRR